MAPDAKSILMEAGKFIITGILTFLSSCLYTDLVTRPAANVSIIPLAIQNDTACQVSPDQLSKTHGAPPAIGTSAADEYTINLVAQPVPLQGWTGVLHRASPAAPDEYRAYLGSINTKYIFQKTVKSNIWTQLQDDRIIACAGSSEASLGTTFAVQGTLIIDQPSTYVLDRDCRLRMDDEKDIPVRAYTALAAGDAPQARESDKTLAVQATTPIFFKYDPTMAPSEHSEDRRPLNRAVEALKKATDATLEYHLSVECDAVSTKGRLVSVGGRPVPFRSGVFTPTKMGMLARIWSAVRS